ncbi:MAG: protein phosphatase 2C domain-containing protein [bacterium]|nr:protein phosphatase 2C domain-containing protein [bacterium]
MIAILVLVFFWNVLRKRDEDTKPKEEGGQEETEPYDADGITRAPHYHDDIEHYMVKTAPELTVRIGKIHSVGRRANQQDTFAYSDVEDQRTVSEKGILLIVADGMGGLAQGAEVSSIVAVEMLRYFDESGGSENPAELLREALLHANQKVNEFLGEEMLGKSGSTVVAALLKEHGVYWISVGDSSIFYYHDNRLTRLNVLHNYALELQEMVERGEITREEADASRDRNALISYIGAGEIARIDQNEEPVVLSAGDRLMLATDGIYGTASMAELEAVMHYDVEEAALKLRYLIDVKGKKNQDNFTAIIAEDHSCA